MELVISLLTDAEKGVIKDKKEIYFLDDQRDDPDVERLLAEKYTLRGEILIYDQIMRLYRLKG